MLGDLLEGGVDARFDRALAQDLGAERVNGADERFFEVGQRGFQILAFDGILRFGSGFVEPLADADFELPGGLVGERDGDDGADFRASCSKQVDDAIGEFGGLAGAGGSFDEQGFVKAFADALACVGVARGGLRCHRGHSVIGSRVWQNHCGASFSLRGALAPPVSLRGTFAAGKLT